MGINIETLVAAKKFTSETVLGGGAVVGKNVTISSITPIDGGNRITFSYTLDNGTTKTSTLDVMNGVNGVDGKDGIGVKGDPGTNGSDGADGIGITSVTKTKTEGLVDTYTITFTDGSTFNYDVTNGKNGKDGSGSSTGEENVIESIKINGVAQTVAEDKSVDITVPTVDVDKNYVDTELAKKANTSDIPSLDGYVTDEELTAKGYLTSHQDISNLVVKEEGKGLSSNDYTSEEKTKLGGVGTSQGRNLISYPYYNGTSYESNGVIYTVNEVDGTITVNGTATKESDFRLISPYDTSDRKTLELGQTYTLSDGVNQPNSIGYQAPVYFQFVRIDTTKNDFNYGISTNYGNMTWTASDANLLQYGIRIVVRDGVTVDNVVMKPMLEIGSIAHMYEPTTESNVSLKKSIETKATINDTSTTSTTETWSAKKINEKTAYNFDNRIILSVSRSSGTYTDTARLNSNTGAYLYWSSVAGQEKYSVGVILYVYNDWLVIPIKETDGGTYINFSVKDSVLTMKKNNTTFPCAGGVIALGTDI